MSPAQSPAPKLAAGSSATIDRRHDAAFPHDAAALDGNFAFSWLGMPLAVGHMRAPRAVCSSLNEDTRKSLALAARAVEQFLIDEETCLYFIMGSESLFQ